METITANDYMNIIKVAHVFRYQTHLYLPSIKKKLRIYHKNMKFYARVKVRNSLST